MLALRYLEMTCRRPSDSHHTQDYDAGGSSAMDDLDLESGRGCISGLLIIRERIPPGIAAHWTMSIRKAVPNDSCLWTIAECTALSIAARWTT